MCYYKAVSYTHLAHRRAGQAGKDVVEHRAALLQIDSACLKGVGQADGVRTGGFHGLSLIHIYLGLDSISPYLPYAEKQGKGMFVLCRTSNGGAKDFEYEKLADGRHVYDLVGDKLTALGKDYMGEPLSLIHICTTLPAPMRALSPIYTGPSTLVPAPISTLLPRVA